MLNINAPAFMRRSKAYNNLPPPKSGEDDLKAEKRRFKKAMSKKNSFDSDAISVMDELSRQMDDDMAREIAEM